MDEKGPQNHKARSDARTSALPAMCMDEVCAAGRGLCFYLTITHSVVRRTCNLGICPCLWYNLPGGLCCANRRLTARAADSRPDCLPKQPLQS